MNKFKGKYRIQSHRKPYWNYSNSGYYFITMVTQNRECNLGEIVDGKMILSDFGKIIKTEWYKSFEICDELFLDKFIILPNHFFQHNYHDHIIRNEKSHQGISEYIINNPLKWNDDRFNPKNQGSDN